LRIPLYRLACSTRIDWSKYFVALACCLLLVAQLLSTFHAAMFSRKPKEPAGPAPVQEAPPTGDYAGSSPAVANLGEFNPNVNDHAHVQKGPRKHHSIAMATHMVPKEDKWSHHTKETVADLKHLTEVPLPAFNLCITNRLKCNLLSSHMRMIKNCAKKCSTPFLVQNVFFRVHGDVDATSNQPSRNKCISTLQHSSPLTSIVFSPTLPPNMFTAS
jgi:hypothetical protein